MTGHQTRVNRAILRAAVGLLTAAAMVLVAPVAAATPETDANDAINQVWDTSGGPTGPLGPKDGGVYPVGEGTSPAARSSSPATGAHIMQGAILEKYESLVGRRRVTWVFPQLTRVPGGSARTAATPHSAP